MKDKFDEKPDGRLDNAQTFKKKNPEIPTKIEDCVIHLHKRMFNDKKHKHEMRWVRRKVGIRRAAIILDATKTIKEVSDLTGISGSEVYYLRDIFLKEVDKPKPDAPKSSYLQYMEEVYDGYSVQPLGAKGPIHSEAYFDTGADIEDRRNMPVRRRTITEYGYRY